VILATHSASFVDLNAPHEIVRCVKEDSGETIVWQVSESLPLDWAKTGQKVRRMGNEELFFAAHVIIVEGQDDQAVIRWLCEQVGVDLDAHNVSVIATDAVTAIPDYMRLCAALRIDHYAIHDADDPTADAKRNERIADAAKACSTNGLPNLHVYSPFLEAQIGLEKHSGLTALVQRLESLGMAQIRESHAELVSPIFEFCRTRGIRDLAQ